MYFVKLGKQRRKKEPVSPMLHRSTEENPETESTNLALAHSELL